MAAGDLTTLDDAKGWLNITSNNSDDLIARLITAATAFLLNYLNRNILQATYTNEFHHGNGSNAMHLNQWPISSITNLTVGQDTVQASSDGLSNGYVFDDKFIYLLPATSPAKFYKGIMNVNVSYVAGYATVPFDIQQACLELVGLKFKEKDRIGIQSQSMNGQQTTSYTPRDLGKDTKAMLQNYRSVVPL